MKDTLKHFFALLVIIPVVMFAIYFLYTGNVGNGHGLFAGIGNLLEGAVTGGDTDPALPDAGAVTGTDAPLLKYSASTQEIDSSIRFKSLFTVITENGEKNGTTEDDFAIYLSDVRNSADVSVVEFLTSEEMDELEEIPAPFIYDEESDMLYCYKSGVFTVLVKVYGANGAQAVYEFLLPVEAQ